MDDYCELTREQIEAALNFLHHVQKERERGREIDIDHLALVRVRRDPANPARVAFEIESDLPRAA